MTTTTNYGITLLEASQAQKEITINEALGVADAMIKGVVLDKDLATPPGSPAAGDTYIVAASPTGAWAGKAKSIAYYDQVWRFITPNTRMRVWVSDESVNYEYNGAAWAISNPSISSISGNAATATALQTARTINGVSFDGTANITVTAAAGTLTGTTLASGVVSSSLTSVGTIATGTWNGTAIAAANGGTGQTSYTIGDLVQASSSSALAKLNAIATGNALISGGVGTVSSWGKIGLTTHVSGTLPVANGGTGDTGTAWSTYTPTITAGSGTFTSVSATGRYKQIGKTTFIQITITITTNGTAGTSTMATLPVNAVASTRFILSGRETNSTGFLLSCDIGASGAGSVQIRKYDNSYVGANGYVISLSGSYEAA